MARACDGSEAPPRQQRSARPAIQVKQQPNAATDQRAATTVATLVADDRTNASANRGIDREASWAASAICAPLVQVVVVG